jgi:hypothetical protein
MPLGARRGVVAGRLVERGDADVGAGYVDELVDVIVVVLLRQPLGGKWSSPWWKWLVISRDAGSRV